MQEDSRIHALLRLLHEEELAAFLVQLHGGIRDGTLAAGQMETLLARLFIGLTELPEHSPMEMGEFDLEDQYSLGIEWTFAELMKLRGDKRAALEGDRLVTADGAVDFAAVRAAMAAAGEAMKREGAQAFCDAYHEVTEYRLEEAIGDARRKLGEELDLLRDPGSEYCAVACELVEHFRDDRALAAYALLRQLPLRNTLATLRRREEERYPELPDLDRKSLLDLAEREMSCGYCCDFLENCTWNERANCGAAISRMQKTGDFGTFMACTAEVFLWLGEDQRFPWTVYRVLTDKAVSTRWEDPP